MQSKPHCATSKTLSVIGVILLATATSALAEQVIYNFQGGTDGSYPTAALIADKAGNLYGTTTFGGTGSCHTRGPLNPQTGCGTVFELSPNGSAGWTENILYSFQGKQDGAAPYSGLTFDKAGNLYGTTSYAGGNASCISQEYGCGTVFELTPNGDGSWVEKILHHFQGGADGGYPGSPLIVDQMGNIYGTASAYGEVSGANPIGCGTVFELTPSGDQWTETILYTFPGTGVNGCGPTGPLVFEPGDKIYGTTNLGGAYDHGAIFEVSPSSSGSWSETVLYSFTLYDGHIPWGLVSDKQGNFYGANYNGGFHTYGDVFEFTTAGQESLLTSFGGSQDSAIFPRSGVTFDSEGNLYGTTQLFSNFGAGIVYKLTPDSHGAWTYEILYVFSGGYDGGQPFGPVIVDAAGRIYGTTWVGGNGSCNISNGPGCGVVFEITQ